MLHLDSGKSTGAMLMSAANDVLSSMASVSLIEDPRQELPPRSGGRHDTRRCDLGPDGGGHPRPCVSRGSLGNRERVPASRQDPPELIDEPDTRIDRKVKPE